MCGKGHSAVLDDITRGEAETSLTTDCYNEYATLITYTDFLSRSIANGSALNPIPSKQRRD